MVAWACAGFDQRKARVLDDLHNNSNDLSPKGSVDAPIAPLISLINSSTDFYTTSCCSGRIALFLHTQPSQPKTGRWLLVEHNPLEDWRRVKEAVEAGTKAGYDSEDESVGVLKFEPFILSIACRSLFSASALLAVAVQSGCRESGIAGLYLPGEGGDGWDGASASLLRPVMVSVRCSIRVEVPVLHHGRCLVSDDFLRLLTQQANDKLHRNWKVCTYLSPLHGATALPFAIAIALITVSVSWRRCAGSLSACRHLKATSVQPSAPRLGTRCPPHFSRLPPWRPRTCWRSRRMPLPLHPSELSPSPPVLLLLLLLLASPPCTRPCTLWTPLCSLLTPLHFVSTHRVPLRTTVRASPHRRWRPLRSTAAGLWWLLAREQSVCARPAERWI